MGVACRPGCSCKRHNRAAHQRAAHARWDAGGAAARAAQSDVAKRVIRRHIDERRADFRGWVETVHGGAPGAEFVSEPVKGLDEHRALAARLGIRVVLPSTLKRYGISELEWLELLAAQGWRCPVCQRRVAQFVTDHEHVKGWKAMPPEERKRYVRGLLCVYDNYKVVPSRMTAEEALRMTAYLHEYEARRDHV